MARRLAVLAICLLAAAAAAAQVRLGPEIALARDDAPEPVGADAVALAANGSDFLLVWEDSRSGAPEVWATRVDSAGHAANPAGRLIGAGSKPRVARAGNGFLVVWQSASDLSSVHVDTNGNPTELPRLLMTGASNPTALLTNGTTYLLIYNYSGAALLDANGTLQTKLINAPIGTFWGATVRNGNYLVAATPLTVTLGQSILYTISDDGTASAIGLAGAGRAAFGDTSILMLTGQTYTVVDYNGRAIKSATTPPLTGAPRDVAAAWDGHEFLAVFAGQNAFRIAADGMLIDASPVALSPNIVTQFTFVNGLAVWTDTATKAALIGRAVSNFDALAAASPPPLNLALAPEQQIDTQVAIGGGTICGVWSSADRYEAFISFNGKTSLLDSTTTEWVGWPAVVAGNRVFLVVWRVMSFHNDSRVLARRFDFSGHPLDAAPIVLDTGGTTFFQYQVVPSAIAFDGSSFFVAWGHEPGPTIASAPIKLYTIRVDENGQLHDRRETVPSDANAYNQVADRASRVLWTGSQFIVLHTIEHYPIINFASDYFNLEMMRVDPASAQITQTTPGPFDTDTGAVVSATLSPDGVTYAWVGAPSIEIAQTKLDGTALRPRRTIVARIHTDGPSYTDIAWDGSKYLLVWLDPVEPGSAARKLRALHLDRNLDPIESAPFDIFSVAGPLTPPRLVTTSNGLLIVYSRSDLENGGAARAFVRAAESAGGRRHAAH